ncbi:MAG: hypothetical protein M3Z35_06605 [Nitrospirota bacterium]|nr:hypothetical protein [Nitrospirota bacterium]
MSACGKAAAVSTSAIVFFQNVISLLHFLPWILHHGVSELTPQELLLQGVRGLGGVLSQALMSDPPLISWTPLRHNAEKEVSDEQSATCI